LDYTPSTNLFYWFQISKLGNSCLKTNEKHCANSRKNVVYMEIFEKKKLFLMNKNFKIIWIISTLKHKQLQLKSFWIFSGLIFENIKININDVTKCFFWW
jgi:hypothetical protein